MSAHQLRFSGDQDSTLPDRHSRGHLAFLAPTPVPIGLPGVIIDLTPAVGIRPSFDGCSFTITLTVRNNSPVLQSVRFAPQSGHRASLSSGQMRAADHNGRACRNADRREKVKLLVKNPTSLRTGRSLFVKQDQGGDPCTSLGGVPRIPWLRYRCRQFSIHLDQVDPLYSSRPRCERRA